MNPITLAKRTGLAALVLSLLAGRPALADHPSLDQMSQVRALAHELDDQAARLHEEAERFAHHGGPREARALADLHALEEAAEHFHAQVERFAAEPEHTEGDWIRLDLAFEQVERSFPDLHAFGGIEATIGGLRETMDALRFFYAVRPAIDVEAVLRLAHELEDAARHARIQAERERHHGTYLENLAIGRLRSLEAAADHFHAQVETLGAELLHIEADFLRLERAMISAESIVPRARFTAHVRNDFERARDRLRELREIYRGVELCPR